MLLETSFCGNKSGSETGAEADPAAEKALLSRQKDPTKAAVVVENGRKPRRMERQSALESEPQVKKKDKPEGKKDAEVKKEKKDEPPKKSPARVKKKSQADPNALVRIIPLHSTDDEDVEVNEPRPESSMKQDIEEKRRRLQQQDTEDLEGQRRKWEEARAKAGIRDDEESDLVKIIPLRGEIKKSDKQRTADKSKSSDKPRPKAKPVEIPKPPGTEVVSKVERAPLTSAAPAKAPSPVPAAVSPSPPPAPDAAVVKRPKRKVDPNALVRIIPLRSEDSYEGYGEEDLPPPKPERAPGEVGVDAIEVDMSTWREPSFEENELVRIIPLKVKEEDLAREKEREERERREREKKKQHTKEHRTPHTKTKEPAPSKPKQEKQDSNELVKIIPLHSSDEEISERERELKKPKQDYSDLVNAVGCEDLVTITPLRRQSRGRSPLRPEHVDVRKECSLTRQKRCEQSKPAQDDLVRIIPLHSPDGSGSEAELAGYAAKAKRQSRKASRPSSRPPSRQAEKPASRTQSPSPAQTAAPPEKDIEPLQIVSLSPDEAETIVAFQRRDLAIQGGHSRTSPQPHDKVDLRTAEQTLSRMLGDERGAKPGTLELAEDQKGGRSGRQVRLPP